MSGVWAAYRAACPEMLGRWRIDEIDSEVIAPVACACLVLGFMRRIEMFWADGLLAFGNTVIAAFQAAVGSAWALYNGGIAVVLALAAWHDWRRRKRRKRAPRTLGAKARARIAAMVTRMRERPARPALRPVPGVTS